MVLRGLSPPDSQLIAESESAFVRSVRFDGMSHVQWVWIVMRAVGVRRVIARGGTQESFAWILMAGAVRCSGERQLSAQFA